MPTPTSNHASLALLRSDPDAALAKYGFAIDNDVYKNTTLGGGCLLSASSAGGNVYRLTATQGSGDFFYPYIYTTGGGVGVCQVPKGQSEGVLVVTGGMNGCSMQANKSGNDFHFYHDNNGNSMKGKMTPGEIVCRVDYKDYAGALEIGKHLVDKYLTGTTGAGYEYYCITVRNGGRWKVYVSSLIRITTHDRAFWSGKHQTTVKYNSFKPTITPLMTSFSDS